MNTEGAAIRSLMMESIESTIPNLLIFTATWYFLTITTAGVYVPSGLSLPGMIIGSAIGLILNKTIYTMDSSMDPFIG